MRRDRLSPFLALLRRIKSGCVPAERSRERRAEQGCMQIKQTQATPSSFVSPFLPLVLALRVVGSLPVPAGDDPTVQPRPCAPGVPTRARPTEHIPAPLDLRPCQLGTIRRPRSHTRAARVPPRARDTGHSCHPVGPTRGGGRRGRTSLLLPPPPPPPPPATARFLPPSLADRRRAPAIRRRPASTSTHPRASRPSPLMPLLCGALLRPMRSQ
jgi:hypothetical protein